MSENKYLIAIPNAIEPYGYEMIPILAYPKGFTFRFRFEKRYVAERVQNSISTLEDKEGFIVLRDRETSKFYPIRYFRVTKAQKVGDIYYFEFSLGELFDISADIHGKNQLKEFNRRFSEFHTDIFKENEPNGNMYPLVFSSNFEPNLQNEHFLVHEDNQERSHERWGNIISSLSEIKFFKGVQFLQMREVLAQDSKGSAEFKDGSLVVTEGSDYALQVVQRVINPDNDISDVDIELKSDENTISILRGALKAVGRYDIFTFYFRANEQVITRKSFLDLVHYPKLSAKGKIEPKIGIPIVIEKTNEKIRMKILLLIMFFLAYIFPGILSILPGSYAQETLNITSEMVKDASIIGLAITLVFLLVDSKRLLK